MINLLFIFDSPIQWVVVIAVIVLLFGANKLPELAKSLGQAKKEFKKGMLETEQDEKKEPDKTNGSELSQLDDESLIKEIQRRQAKQLEKPNQD